MIIRYYYTDESGNVNGPHSTDELSSLRAAGKLADASQVCAEGQETWVDLSSVLQSASKPTSRLSEAQKNAATKAVEAKSPQNEITFAGTTRTQASIIIVLLLIGLGMPFLGTLRPTPKWEYTHLTFLAGDNERMGTSAFKYSSISLDQSKLKEMGNAGWEMIGSYLEMETAFPNFGKEEYTTGLQPNIRPQSLVILFKRPLR